MTGQEFIKEVRAWKELTNELLTDFIEIIEGTPTEKQQEIIDRYRDTIARCDKTIKELETKITAN